MKRKAATHFGSGKYAVVAPLTTTGMSEVFLGIERSNRQNVVIKLARGNFERFRGEVKALQILQHPAVIAVLDSGSGSDEKGEFEYYVMPYLGLDTLASRFASAGPMTPLATSDVMAQTASVLSFVHARSIVHRDLKPSNMLAIDDEIMLSGYRITLLDLGVGKDLASGASGTVVNSALGTPDYMSPEQWKNAAAADHRSDLYSLGIIGYEALAGRPPFLGSLSELQAHHLHTPLPSIRTVRPDVPKELDELLQDLARKNPDERPRSALEVTKRLSAVRQAVVATAPTQFVSGPSTCAAVATDSMQLAPGLGRVAIAAGKTLLAPTPDATTAHAPARQHWTTVVLAGLAAATVSATVVLGLALGRAGSRQCEPAALGALAVSADPASSHDPVRAALPLTDASRAASLNGRVMEGAPAPPHAEGAASAPPRLVAPGGVTAAMIEAECRRFQAQQQWKELTQCAGKLQPFDRARAALFQRVAETAQTGQPHVAAPATTTFQPVSASQESMCER